ncbi:MAG TPA: phosphopantetheine-binding protein, partial [Pseudomonadales bacterium]|nr:phosphopantetheine-binding protein [Pseudomonadales bacterium]
MQPLPPGAVGELYIGGQQVGNGYWQQGALTQSRFLSTSRSTTRLYKTGDLVRWRKDGSLEYIGRNDFQVKLRGMRIELGEIEAALNKHRLVNDSVVILKKDQLIGYILTDQGPTSREIDWRAYLRAYIPDYMIPSHIMALKEWPLNPNGKLDRHALPEPELRQVERYVGPTNDVELKLVEIWEETLNRSQVGVTDNFFDLGGNSLIATRTIAK